MIKRLAALVMFLAFAAATAGAQNAVTPVGPTLTPTPTPVPIGTLAPTAPAVSPPPPASAETPAAAVSAPASASASATAAAKPTILQFTGQLLDIRDHYVYFTTGDAFPIVDVPRIVEYETGALTSVPPAPKMFARASMDPVSKKVFQLEITKRRLATTQKTAAVAALVVMKSKPVTAPEIVGQALTGKQVAVTFEVTAPPTTSLRDELYISTDASNWNAQAIKLDRIDAYKYRALRYFASGTKFAYRVTRGSWNSVERGEDNLDAKPHQFFVREVDALAARVTVYHWSDENPAAQGAGPNSIPTPYNSNPFGGGAGGIIVPQRPTPQPTVFR